MKYLWILSSILLYVASGHGLVNCPRKDKKCMCLPGSDIEYHCPQSSESIGGLIMHFKQQEQIVEIDCYYQLPNVTAPKFFNVDLLPDAKIGKIYRLEIRFCPLPERNFKEILEKLSITSLKGLKFGSSDTESIRLNGSYFEGLEMLEELVIEKNKLLILEDDVFDNTPQLTDIELTESNNLKISSQVFKKTPLLKSLDISGNHLESLPEGVFQHLENLRRLHLWNNNLTTIDEFMFKNLTNLKSLELSVNNIDSVSENAFRNLGQLFQVSLKKNKLNLIPANLFQGNLMLKKVVMKSNPTLKLPDYLFQNSSLENVELSDCNLESIPEHIFENSKHLGHISLSHNRLKNLSNSLFKSLENLSEVELQSNSIEDISNVFANLNNLKRLNLEGNLITTIDKETFEDLNNLEYLNLRRNRITQIHPGAFNNHEKLQTFILSHNMITGEVENPYLGTLFQNVVNLEEIDLSHNLITQVENIIYIQNKVQLKTLDLRFNRITNIRLNSLQTVTTQDKLIIRLENNNITTVDFGPFLDLYKVDEKTIDAYSTNDDPYSEIYLAYNPLNCDCNNYDLVRHLRMETPPEVQIMFEIKKENLICASPIALREVSLDKLPPQALVCSLEEVVTNYTGCSDVCSCSWRPFDESIVIDCSDKNLQTFPEIVLPPANRQLKYNQSEVHLENNYLTTGPDSNLPDYEKVTKLYLSNNNISTVTWLPPGLQILKLDNNELDSLNYEVLQTLNTTSLLNLTLNSNPWLCDCESENLTSFLRQHARQVDVSDVYCSNTSVRLVNLSRKDLCHEWQIAYIIIPIMALLLASAIVVALYYRYQKELKIWLFAKNLCLWWVTEEDLDKDKIYDAFISYSHKDEDFVTQNLLPRLEGGPNPYKLCLHYRNWVPGEFIAKQVTNSVLESRRTLVVLSPSFLESVWGKLEFRTAHTQAMTEGRARVIIVLYGDVDVNSLDSELKAYLKTNTYVKWGEPYFWNKLIYALPHSKRNISHNQKHANVMNCIDDKFKLVVPVTTSPGSTPPVLALDATSLKKHPLNFIPSNTDDMDTPPAEAGTLLTSTCL